MWIIGGGRLLVDTPHERRGEESKTFRKTAWNGQNEEQESIKKKS